MIRKLSPLPKLRAFLLSIAFEQRLLKVLQIWVHLNVIIRICTVTIDTTKHKAIPTPELSKLDNLKVLYALGGQNHFGTLGDFDFVCRIGVGHLLSRICWSV